VTAPSQHERFIGGQKQFEAIARRCGDRLHVSEIDLAGARVRLRIAGDVLNEYLVETFAHLQAPPSTSPDLEIDAWAEDETGEEGLPAAFLGEAAFTTPIDGGMIEISADERFLAYRVGEHSLSWLDRRAGRIVASVRRPHDLLLRERVKPFGALIPLWLRDRDVRVLHAAAIAVGERAVILPGNSGAGKSTCATVCVEAGLDYIGDDTIALQENDAGGFIAHSMYGAARLWPADGAFFPEWYRHAVHPHGAGDEPKLLFYVGRRHRDLLVRRANVAALAFPRFSDTSHGRLRRLNQAQALRALVASSLFLSVTPEREDFEHLLRLATSLPAYEIELGTDRRSIPALVEQCLHS
jgi:hypothetical protein